MSEQVTLRVARRAGPTAPRQWQRFAIKPARARTLADLLQLLNRAPRTIDDTEVAPVRWSSSCAWPCCGGCMMRVNGRATVACTSSWRELLGKRKELVLEPLAGFAVVADLLIDRSSMLADMIELHSWTSAGAQKASTQEDSRPASDGAAGAERDGHRFEAAGVCTQCGACHDACPVVGGGAPFAGPAALFESHRLSLLPSAHIDEPARLAALRGDRGVHACGFAFACADACPQSLPLDEIVTERSAAAARDGLRRMLGRG